MRYDATCTQCGDVEIEKPMASAFPARHSCGGTLTRRFSMPSVHYASPGFYSTDVAHFRNQIGPERYAKFEHDRAAAQRRAHTGTLTPYERQLQNV